LTIGRWPWVSLTVVAACLAAGLLTGGGESIQYERSRVASGDIWRLLTGQMVHWTPRMALVDLGMLLLLGASLEATGRRPAASLAIGASVVLCAAGIHVIPSGQELYRGSSGIASALFVLLCLELIVTSRSPRVKLLSAAALTLIVVKAVWESSTGRALGAGALPDGVVVSARVHLLGGLAGALVAATVWLRGGREAQPAG
jgi:rhomboid family GlyGly-CTERM serine protease